jgi:predicted RNase H-like nuclease (RuvC/YqgF family)
MSGFSSNFSGPHSRIRGVGQTAVSPFSDDQRPEKSDKREILKLKQKIEERDECIKNLVQKINQIEKSVNNLNKRSSNNNSSWGTNMKGVMLLDRHT